MGIVCFADLCLWESRHVLQMLCLQKIASLSCRYWKDMVLIMIRLILVALALLLYFIVTLPLYLVLLLIGTKRPDIRAKVGQKSVKWGFKVILAAAGVQVRVKGLENIPKVPVLFVGNHRSFFDIPVIYSTVPLQTGFVSKMQVKKVPFLSWWMTCINCLFLDRQDVKQALQMILAGIEHIKNGTSICIMPEGTRNYGDEMLPFKEGSFKMAEKTCGLSFRLQCGRTTISLKHSFRGLKQIALRCITANPSGWKSFPKKSGRRLVCWFAEK